MTEYIVCRLCGDEWTSFPDRPEWNIEELKYHADKQHPPHPWWWLTDQDL